MKEKNEKIVWHKNQGTGKRGVAFFLCLCLLFVQIFQGLPVRAASAVGYNSNAISNSDWQLSGGAMWDNLSGEELLELQVPSAVAQCSVSFAGIQGGVAGGTLKAVFSASAVVTVAASATFEFKTAENGALGQQVIDMPDNATVTPVTGQISIPAGTDHVDISLATQGYADFTDLSFVVSDQLAPLLTATYNANWANDDVAVQLTAQDAADTNGSASGVEGIYDADISQKVASGTEWAYTATESGTRHFYSVDDAGNKSATQTVTVQIDREAPAAPAVTLSTPGAWAKAATLMLGDVTAPAGQSPETRQYRLGTGEWQAYSDVVTLPEGSYTVQARTVDTAGNASAATQAVTAMVDATAPAVTAAVQPHSAGGATVTVTAQDAAPVVGVTPSGIAQTKWAAGVQTAEYVVANGTVITGNTFEVTQGGSYTVLAADNAGNTATTAAEVNLYPSLAAISAQTMAEDTTRELTFAISDPEGAALTVQAVSANTDLLANPVVTQEGGNATLTLAPLENKNGATQVTVSLSDGVNTQTQTFAVTVTAVNDDPVLQEDSATTREDTPVTVDVLANDTDIDGDALTLVSDGITASSGTATVQDGQIKFTPAANFNGSATVTYTVTDGTVQKMATITITVTPVNDAPVLQGATSITTAEDTVVANTFVTDVDNSELTFTLTTPPAHGAVAFEAVTGASVTTYRYVYTPATDYYGTDTFTVKVSDGAATVTRSISFTLTAVNDAPVFDGLTAAYDIAEDAPQQTVNFTIGDAETATSALMLQVSSQNEALIPAASLTLDGLGTSDGNVTLHYTPAANAHGTAVLRLKLSDGFLVTTKDITVQVASVNDAPAPVADALSYTEDTPLVIDMDDLVANDKDIDGDALAFAGVNTLPDAAVGTLVETNAATHEWTFTPAANTNEAATFTYLVSDGVLQSQGQVTLTAKGVNDRPTLVLGTGNTYTTPEDTGLDITFTVDDLETTASDLIVLAGTDTPGVVGADRLTITRGADGLCTLHIAPNDDQNGTATITLTVSDSKLMAATSFDITVTPVQDPPVGVNDYVFAAKMGKVEFEPLANDTDPDGDTLSIASYTQPDGGQVTQDGDKLVFRDTLGTVRVTTFTYTVSDGHGNTADATVNVSVGGASFPPTITPVAAQYINEDATTAPLAFTVADPEGAPLTVSAQSDNTTLLPNNFASNILLTQNPDGSCTVQLVPAANANGTATVTLSVSDGDNTTTTSFKLTVYPVNDLPVAADDTVTTNEDTVVTIDVLANDSDLETAHASLRVTDITQPTHGRLALAGTGKYTYTPYANFNGSDSFTYTMTDGQVEETATVNITVDAVNDAPRIWRDIWRSLASTTETTPVDIAFIQSGIVGDVDNTLDELYIAGVQNEQGGTVTISEDKKSVSFTPDVAGVGGSFEIRIRDRAEGDASLKYSGWATVHLGVGGSASLWSENAWVERDEDSAPYSFNLMSYIHKSGSFSNITINTSNLSAATAALDMDVAAQTATLTITPKPDAYTTTTESLTYTVTDSDNGLTTNGNVYVTLYPVNDAPTITAAAGSQPLADTTLPEDTVAGPYVVDLADVDSSDISFQVYLQNSDADHPVLLDEGVSLQRTGDEVTVKLNPVENASGSATVTLVASDGMISTSKSFTATFTPVNDAPVAAGSTQVVFEDTKDNEFGIELDHADPDGDTLTLSIAEGGAPQHGTASVSGATILYTPASNYNGPDSIIYQLTDPDGAVAQATIQITVQSVNDLPVIAGLPADYATQEDAAAFALPFTVSDVDGEALQVTMTHTNEALFPGLKLVGSGSTWRIEADSADNAFGTDTVTVTVKDAEGLADETKAITMVVELSVASVNDLPDAQPDSGTTAEDTPVLLDVLANDHDIEDDAAGRALQIIEISAPAHGTVTYSGGKLLYSPAANYYGTDSFTYMVSDSNDGHVANVPVSLQITPVNDAPNAKPDSSTIEEDGEAEIDVLANDTDVENNDLVLVAGGFSALADGSGTVQHGTVSISAGKVVFAPYDNWNGTAVFYYTVSDQQAENSISRAKVTVTVRPVNDVPTMTDADDATDDWVMNEDEASAANRTFSFSVADVETSPQNLIVTLESSNASVFPATAITLQGTEVKTIVLPKPPTNWNGVVNITVSLSDGVNATQKVYRAVVTPVNDAPVLTVQAITTAEDTPKTAKATSTDVDGGTPVYSIATPSLHGTVSINETTGSYTYAPAANYYGSDSFVVQVSDGNGGTAQKTVAVTVTPDNDAPAAQADTAETDEDTPVLIDVLANDSDIENDTLSLVTSGITGATGGSASVQGSQIKFTPALNFNGTAGFSYTVTDGTAQTTAHVTVTVHPVNDAPTLAAPALSVTEDVPAASSFVGSDVDGDTLHYAVTTLPAHGNLSLNTASGSYAYAPAPNYNGPDSFVVQASDGNGGVATKTVSFTVLAANDAPAAGDVDTTTAEDTPVLFDVLALASDIDADPTLNKDPLLPAASKTLSIAPAGFSGVEHGTVQLVSDGGTTKIKFTPTANWNGVESFAYTITDGLGAQATATITLAVTPVNDAPTAVADSVLTAEDSNITVDVLANDTDVDASTALNTYPGATLDQQLKVISLAGVDNGVAEIVNNNVVFRPNVNWHGDESFQYTIEDASGAQATATVSITVVSVNDAPVAVRDTATTQEDTPVVIDVLANDTDADTATDAEVLTIQLVSDVTGGSAVMSPDNKTVTYTPAANNNGTFGFNYTVRDVAGATSSAAVTVTVTPVNDAPVAQNDTATTPEDTPATLDLLANDTDVDLAQEGDTLTITQVTGALHGTTQVAPNGKTVLYTPAANWHGAETLTYTMQDAAGETDTAQVAMTVTPVNDAPLAPTLLTPTGSDAYKDGQTVHVTWATATDVDGDSVSYRLEFYDGSVWHTLADGLTDTAYDHLLTDTGLTSNMVCYRVTATDGVVQVPATGERFIIDNTAPAAVLVTATQGNGSWAGATAQFSLSGGQDLLPFTYAYSTDGSKWVTLAGGQKVSFATRTLVYYRAVDQLGNTFTGSVELFVDLEAPVFETSAPTAPTNQNVPITLQLSTDPGGSGNDYMLLPDGTRATPQDTIVWSATNNGSYTFTLVDVAGNRTEKTVTVSNIDRVPPVIQLSSSVAAGRISTKPISLNIDVTDAASGISSKTISLSGAAGGAQGSTVFSLASDGTYYVHVTATDGAGNTATAVFGPFSIDSTPPKVSYKVSDLTSKGGKILLDVPQGATGTVKLTLPDGTVVESTIADFNFTATQSGEYILEVSDEAGNVTRQVITVTLPDDAVPQAAPTRPAETPAPAPTELHQDSGIVYSALALGAVLLVLLLLLALRRPVKLEYEGTDRNGKQKRIVKRRFAWRPAEGKTLKIDATRRFAGVTVRLVTVSMTKGFSKRMRKRYVSIWLDDTERARILVPQQQNERWSHTLPR